MGSVGLSMSFLVTEDDEIYFVYNNDDFENNAPVKMNHNI
jgi:hypothetical protein